VLGGWRRLFYYLANDGSDKQLKRRNLGNERRTAVGGGARNRNESSSSQCWQQTKAIDDGQEFFGEVKKVLFRAGRGERGRCDVNRQVQSQAGTSAIADTARGQP